MPDCQQDPSPAFRRASCISESSPGPPAVSQGPGWGSARQRKVTAPARCERGDALVADEGCCRAGRGSFGGVCLVDGRLWDGAEGCRPRVLGAPDLHAPWLGW